jgi:hypothetical protein
MRLTGSAPPLRADLAPPATLLKSPQRDAEVMIEASPRPGSRALRRQGESMGQIAVERPSPHVVRGNSEILDCIRRIREVFDQNFDRAWFGVLMDDVPMGISTLRDIRSLVLFDSILPGDEEEILSGLVELEEFVRSVRSYLLPLIREKLGISRLKPRALVRDRNQYLLRRLLAYTFPYNVERLASLTRELRLCLSTYYPRTTGAGRN